MSTASRLAGSAAVAVAAVAFAVLLCEVGLRLSGYRPPLTDREMYVAADSPTLPYKLKPGYRGTYLGQEVEIDADGYRVSAPRAELRPAGAPGKRILLVGDSIVFGHGLASDATLGAQLQNALWREGRRDEVRSIGVAGYGSWNEYEAVEEYLRTKTADVIVVVYVANDVSFDNDQLGIGKGKYATRESDWFHRVTQWVYGHVYIAYLTVDRVQGWRYSSGPRRATSVDADALAYSLAGLERLRDLCRSRGIVLLVGVYRDVWHYDDPAGSLGYEQEVTKGLTASGIDSFVLASHVVKLDLHSARRAWNDAHPSAAAVACMAQDAAAALAPVLGAVPTKG